MKIVSDAPVDGMTALSALAPAFSLVAIASGLLAAFGFGGGIDGPLNNGGAGLRHDIGNGFCHSLLWQGIGHNGCGQGGNLHGQPRAFSRTLKQLLHFQNEEIINLSVIYYVLDKCLIRLGKCGIRILQDQRAGL
jgi:hypothetical protein